MKRIILISLMLCSFAFGQKITYHRIFTDTSVRMLVNYILDTTSITDTKIVRWGHAYKVNVLIGWSIKTYWLDWNKNPWPVNSLVWAIPINTAWNGNIIYD